MNVLDLFSGIGGFSLGLERAGFRTVAFCEIDPYARRVLAKHWPEVPCYDDVRTLTAERLKADGISVDVICGGFPCQDISVAGKQEGIGEDTRSGLWSEVARLTRELQPRFVIVENVSNLLSGPSEQPGGWFGRILGDLAEIGYDAEWHCIPASYVGAAHQRDRVWVVAYSERAGLQRPLPNWGASFGALASLTIDSDAPSVAWRALDGDCNSLRVSDGVSVQMERNRIRACGNAVVPQIPEIIGRAIMECVR